MLGIINLEMMVYNMVQLNKTEDASVNLDLIKIKTVGFDLGPSLKLGNGRLISTGFILGHFAAGMTNSVVIVFDKKKMLDAGVASGDVRARQIRLPFCSVQEFGFNSTLIVCCEQDRPWGEPGVSNIYVKDFGMTA